MLVLPWSTLLWHRCYYPHRSRDALSPVCEIFFFSRPVVEASLWDGLIKGILIRRTHSQPALDALIGSCLALSASTVHCALCCPSWTVYCSLHCPLSFTTLYTVHRTSMNCSLPCAVHCPTLHSAHGNMHIIALCTVGPPRRVYLQSGSRDRHFGSWRSNLLGKRFICWSKCNEPVTALWLWTQILQSLLPTSTKSDFNIMTKKTAEINVLNLTVKTV